MGWDLVLNPMMVWGSPWKLTPIPWSLPWWHLELQGFQHHVMFSVFCPSAAGVRGDLPLHRGAAVHGPEGPRCLLQWPAAAGFRGDRWAMLHSLVSNGKSPAREAVLGVSSWGPVSSGQCVPGGWMSGLQHLYVPVDVARSLQQARSVLHTSFILSVKRNPASSCCLISSGPG